MKALAGALEVATGGVVVHRTGGSVLLYRSDILNESTQADETLNKQRQITNDKN